MYFTAYFTAPPHLHTNDRRLTGRRLLILAFAAVACALGLERQAAWAAFPAKTGLISHWTLDEVNGTRTDSHGTNFLTVDDFVVSGTGKIHRGASFIRSNGEYLSRSDTASLSAGNSSWTISAWVQLESTPSGQMTVVSKAGGTLNTSEYSVQWTSANNRFSVSLMTLTATTTVTANNFGDIAIDQGQWYHVVAWHDADNDEIGISVNGEDDVQGNFTSGANDTTENFRLGANGGGAPNVFDGVIDEVSFWKRVLTPEERAALYNGAVNPDGTVNPFSGRGVWFPGLTAYWAGGHDSTEVMNVNVITLQNWAASNGGWMTDREDLNLIGDFYWFNNTVEWGTRTGLPVVRGDGGEPIWHPISQYAPHPTLFGGPVTLMTWKGTDYTKSMWDILGYGWTIDGVHFMGKQEASDSVALLKDDTSPTKLDYPYTDPLTTHPGEDRCRYAIRVMSQTAAFGNGKGVFPRGVATHLFQVGILADDDPEFANHNDQCHVLGRFAPAYCDVGFWSKQRQAFSWNFDQIDSASRWTILLDAGGKLTVDQLDMGLNCDIGLFVRGSDAAQGTGPDETIINYINIDELAPNNCLLVKTDSNHTGNYESSGTNTGEITTDVIHSVKVNEIVTVTWGSGQQRTGMKVIDVDDTTIEIADNPTPPPDAGGNALPTSGSTPMTVVRYSATSTVIGAAHVPIARATQVRGDVIFTDTGADFTASTRIVSGLTANVGPLSEPLYVEFYNTAVSTTYPVFVGKIDSVDDVAGTFRLTPDVFFGAMPGDLNNTVKVVVYGDFVERPIFSFKNTYGIHRINNLRLGYGRMIRAQGGIETHPVRTIFDGVLFGGRSRNADGTEFGPTWLYAGPYASSIDPASAVARAIAMLYTTDSIGYVQGELTAAYEEPSTLTHGGKRYQNLSWYGSLNGAGAFTATNLDIKVW